MFHGSMDVDSIYEMLGRTHNYWLNTFGRDGANMQGGLRYNPPTDTRVYVHEDLVSGWFSGWQQSLPRLRMV